MKLYKYRADGAYTEKGLMEKTVWLAKPKELNDPFECTILPPDGAQLDELERSSMELKIASFVLAIKESFDLSQPFFNISVSDIGSLLDALNHLPSLEAGVEIIDRAFYQIGCKPNPMPVDLLRSMEERLQAVGIYSLSERNDDPKMWAQYAGDHSGLALEFDVSGSCKLSDPSKCKKVNYVETMVRSDPEGMRLKTAMHFHSDLRLSRDVEFSLTSGIFSDAIFTKGVDWSSEMEWRYVESSGGSKPFPARLSALIFGYRMPKSRRDFYRSLILKHYWYSVSFREIRRVNGTNNFGVFNL